MEKARPLFEIIGKKTWLLGEDPKQANAAKIAGNMMITMAIEAMAEAVVLTESNGLAPEAFFDLILNTLFSGRSYEQYKNSEGRLPGWFQDAIGFEGPETCVKAAGKSGKQLPMLDAVLTRVTEAVDSEWARRTGPLWPTIPLIIRLTLMRARIGRSLIGPFNNADSGRRYLGEIGRKGGVGHRREQRDRLGSCTALCNGRGPRLHHGPSIRDSWTRLSRFGKGVTAVRGDVTRHDDLDTLFETVKEGADKLDILVTSSGVSEHSTIDEISEAHFDRAFDLNVRAMVFVVQRAIPLLSIDSAIVLIGSIAGSIGTPGYGTYGASKASVRSFARTWTCELAGRNIRVNTLSPGPTDTAMFAEASDEARQSLINQIPLHRFARPEEVAAAAMFLASDESSFIAGTELVIDGGMSQV